MVIQDEKIPDILDALECHNIRKGVNFYTASNTDGNAKAAINIYIETLSVKNHTRSDFPQPADIITLVEYIRKIYFVQAINWICEVCGYDYYDGYDKKEIEVDPCVAFLDEIESKTGNYEEIKFRKLNDNVLNEYIPDPNIWFLNEGIDLSVQSEFELGYCLRNDRITIPIRDELGNLVGVKGRTVLDHNELDIPKYLYLYPMPKSLVLYGLYKTYPYIKEKNEVIVFESEKSVMMAWGMGYKNCVSIGGHELSLTQVLKLEKLGVEITFAFDKDIDTSQIKNEYKKFIIRDRVYAIFDKSHLLSDKQSPVDAGLNIWSKLYSENKYKL